MPQVLNLRGRKGVVPEGAVYIGDHEYHKLRRLPRSKWYNPYNNSASSVRS